MVAFNTQLTTSSLPFAEPFLAIYDVMRMWCHNSWHHNNTHWGKGSKASSALHWLKS